MVYIHERGQTLIEVIIAIALCGLVLVGVAKLIASSFTNVDFSEEQVNASNIAQQGMAIIGNLHDTDYTTFQNHVGNTYCLGQNQDITTISASAVPCATPNAGPNPSSYTYIRSIALQNGGSCSGTNNVQVTVKVQWNDKDCGSSSYCHSSQLVSCYSNANVAPAL